MKTKILLINKMFSPEIGGIETVVKQQAEYLSKAYDVTVLCATKKLQFVTKKYKEDGYDVIRVSSFGSLFGLPLSFMFPFYVLLYIRRFDLAIIHLPNPYLDIMSIFFRLVRTKLVVYWHSDIVRQSFIAKAIAPLTRILLSQSTVWTTSENLRKNSIHLSGLPKVSVLPIGISDPAAGERQEIDVPETFLLSFGRLAAYKGIVQLLKAYAISKAAKSIPLVICGTGPCEDEIKENIKNLGLCERVYFINREISEKEKNYLFYRCKAFLFPSCQPSEAYGITQVEALAFSKPVINTSLETGVPWVSLDSVTGLTAEANNYLDFATKIDELIDSDLEEMTRNCRQRYEQVFHISKVNSLLNVLVVFAIDKGPFE